MSESVRHLNNEAWYVLPNGTPVIAAASDEGGYVLYTEQEWEGAATADYEVQPAGRVTFQGQVTGWTSADLVKMPAGVEPTECAYCGATVADPGDTSVPSVDDDGAWDALAGKHHEGCEWTATRAHRRGARLTGYDAINYAERGGALLSKYNDPTEDARDGLTVTEAREVASDDPSLIYVDVAVAHA